MYCLKTPATTESSLTLLINTDLLHSQKREDVKILQNQPWRRAFAGAMHGNCVQNANSKMSTFAPLLGFGMQMEVLNFIHKGYRACTQDAQQEMEEHKQQLS